MKDAPLGGRLLLHGVRQGLRRRVKGELFAHHTNLWQQRQRLDLELEPPRRQVPLEHLAVGHVAVDERQLCRRRRKDELPPSGQVLRRGGRRRSALNLLERADYLGGRSRPVIGGLREDGRRIEARGGTAHGNRDGARREETLENHPHVHV